MSPRAVALTRADADGSITDIRYTLPLQIEGRGGANATGVSVGGFGLSEDNCLIAGNSVRQEEESYSASGQRNIFLSVVKKDLAKQKNIWLTEYAENSGISVRTPQLVKINDCQPVALDNGMVKWYAGDGKNMQLYEVNPYKMENVSLPASCINSHTWEVGKVLKAVSCSVCGAAQMEEEGYGDDNGKDAPQKGKNYS